jgi:A/G-specific adenine glycosylase
MAVLRDTEGTVARSRLEAVWPETVQRERALQSLLDDGLVVQSDGDRYSLPH